MFPWSTCPSSSLGILPTGLLSSTGLLVITGFSLSASSASSWSSSWSMSGMTRPNRFSMISDSLAADTFLAMTMCALSLQCSLTSASTYLPASTSTPLQSVAALSSFTAWKERALGCWFVRSTGALSCPWAEHLMP